MSPRERDTCKISHVTEKRISELRTQLEKENLESVSLIFKALSDETRLKIIYALSTQSKLCVCDIAEITENSVATASHHLRQLKKMGLARSEKEGKQVYYALDDEHVADLLRTGLVHQKEVATRH